MTSCCLWLKAILFDEVISLAERVTQNMLSNTMLRNLKTSYTKMERLQEKLTSGREIQFPSDDPVVASRGMFYRTSLIEIEQFQRNVKEGKNWMESTEKAMEEIGDIVKRTRELMVQVNNGTYESGSLKAIEAEIQEIRNHLGIVANSTLGGRYIFNGTLTKTAPYSDENGWSKTASIGDIFIEVNKDVKLSVNIPGTRLFAFPNQFKYTIKDAQTGVDQPVQDGIFGLFDKMINDLKKGDRSNLDKYLIDVDHQYDNLVSERTQLGAKINRMDLVESRLTVQNLSITRVLASEEDADIAAVITELKAQENVHRAALQTGAKIIQPSLMDFLR